MKRAGLIDIADFPILWRLSLNAFDLSCGFLFKLTTTNLPSKELCSLRFVHQYPTNPAIKIRMTAMMPSAIHRPNRDNNRLTVLLSA